MTKYFKNRLQTFLIIMFITITITILPTILTTAESTNKTRALYNEWPEPYGDSENRGITSTSIPPTATISWSKTGIAVFSSQPLISEGTLILIQDKVYAYDAETGTEKWTYSAQSLRTPPAIGGGRLFGGNRPFVALDILDGSLLWSHDAFPMSPPTVYKDRVFVAELNKLYAFNVINGSVEWTFDCYNCPKVAVADDVVYIVNGAGYDAGLYALNAANGEQLWFFDTGTCAPYPPIIVEENIYFISSNIIYGVRKSDGKQIFFHSINGAINTPMSAGNDRLYFGTGEGVIHGIRINDSLEDWTLDTATLGAEGAFATGITLANNGIIFITVDDKLWAVGYDKALKWSFDDIYIFNSIEMDKDILSVCNGYVYVAEFDGGKIWAFGPELPVATIEVKSQSLHTETSIKFDASGSSSENGRITEYYFDFGDGTNSGWQPEATAKHTYEKPGTYEVIVQVRDISGLRSPITTTTIEVSSNPTYLTTAVIIGIVIIIVIVAVILIMVKWRKERKARQAKKAAKRLELSMLVPSPWIKYQNTQILYLINLWNKANYPISDITVQADIPADIFKVDKIEESIPMISPGQTKQAQFIILPTGECGDRELKARFRYYDYNQKKHEEFTIGPVNVSLVCPILKPSEITPRQWKHTTSHLVNATETFTDIPMSSASLEVMLSRTLQEFNLYPLPSQHLPDSSANGGSRLRFFAIGVKGTPYAVELAVKSVGAISSVTITAWANSPQTLVGFYHGLLDAIEKRVQIRDHIRETVVIRDVEGDYIEGQRIDIEDSVVSRSQIGGLR